MDVVALFHPLPDLPLVLKESKDQIGACSDQKHLGGFWPGHFDRTERYNAMFSTNEPIHPYLLLSLLLYQSVFSICLVDIMEQKCINFCNIASLLGLIAILHIFLFRGEDVVTEILATTSQRLPQNLCPHELRNFARSITYKAVHPLRIR